MKESDLIQTADPIPAEVQASPEAPAPQRPATNRLQSLDSLRGITVALMILVNTSGDGAPVFDLGRRRQPRIG